MTENSLSVALCVRKAFSWMHSPIEIVCHATSIASPATAPPGNALLVNKKVIEILIVIVNVWLNIMKVVMENASSNRPLILFNALNSQHWLTIQNAPLVDGDVNNALKILMLISPLQIFFSSQYFVLLAELDFTTFQREIMATILISKKPQ